MKAGGRAYVPAGVLRVHAALQRPAEGDRLERPLYPFLSSPGNLATFWCCSSYFLDMMESLTIVRCNSLLGELQRGGKTLQTEVNKSL